MARRTRKFFSDLRQVDGFHRISSTNKTDRHNITEILLTVALNTIPPLLFMVITNVTKMLLPKVNNIVEATKLLF
jgi:hypothetical protein